MTAMTVSLWTIMVLGHDAAEVHVSQGCNSGAQRLGILGGMCPDPMYHLDLVLLPVVYMYIYIYMGAWPEN